MITSGLNKEISFWFWIHNKIECYVLVLQSAPVNPWAQLQLKELIPSTQTPPFKQGLVSQSSMSKKIEYLLENLNNYQIFIFIWFFYKIVQYLRLTDFTIRSCESSGANTGIRSNSINTCSSIVTWIILTVINI